MPVFLADKFGALTIALGRPPLYAQMESAVLAEDEEILKFIEHNQLMGKGLGYIDVHLIASAVLTSVLLWTLDKTLDKFTEKLGIDY